jgi:transposase
MFNFVQKIGLIIPTSISALQELVKQLHEANTLLMQRVAELERQLNQNSRNSHKPPSSDGYRKAAAIKPKIKKQQGGQLNHKGDTLKKISSPDKVVDLRPEQCYHCDKKLGKNSSSIVYDTRQVFDLPPIKLHCTEFRRLSCTCSSCGKATILNDYPHGVNSEVQYGSNFRAFITLLHQEGCVPVAKLKAISSALFSCPINEGTICQIQQMAFQKLAPFESIVIEQLQKSAKVHADETGIRIEGKLQWLHTLGNERFTVQFPHQKRGFDAHIGTISFLPNFQNWLIHDFWSAYLKFDKCFHAFCMAHILRELQALIEQGKKWAERFRKFFLRLYKQTGDGKEQIADDKWLAVEKTFRVMLRLADKEEPKATATGKRGRTKQTKGRNLLDRFTEHIDGVLAFARYEVVPFTNNLAERDLRPAKSKIKIAGNFRAFSGAQAYARIRSFISTAKKHQSNPFNELVRVFEGNMPTFLVQYS